MDELMTLVENYDGVAMTTSLKIAEVFGKEHRHVLDSIRNLTADFSAAKFFHESTYTRRGKEYPMYEMDRDGFSLLAMGFNGEKALQWKLKYLEAFNLMEQKLKESNILTEEEKLKLQLFSKNPVEVTSAYNKLIEIETEKATLPLKQEIKVQKETIEEKSTQIKEMKPKASYFDKVMQCPDLLSTTDIAKDYGWSAVTLNKFLKEQKIQYKNKNGNTWYLYQKYAEKGYTSTKTNIYFGKDGKEHAKPHMYWTQKGRLFIYKTMKENGILPIVERDDFEEEV